MPQRRHTSIGEMISSGCFFCVGLWLISEAMIAEHAIKAAGLAICGLASFLATFRYRLGRFYDARFNRDD